MRRSLGVGILMLMLLTGCAGAPVQTEAPEPEQEETAEVIPALTLEPAIQLTTEEEILSAYDQALEAWRWFYAEPLPHGAETQQIGGRTYWKVLSRRFQTMQDLRAHLRWLFSEELTGCLLDEDADYPPYREIDGALYVRESVGAHQDHHKGNQQFQVEQETETRYSVNITVDLLDEYTESVVGLEFWSFPYELQTDRWVFTDFELIDG